MRRNLGLLFAISLVAACRTAVMTAASGTTTGSGSGGAGTIAITAFGAAGDAIDGTFAINMSQSTPGGPTLPLSGSFHVCHRPDVSSP